MNEFKHTPAPWGIENTPSYIWVGPMRPDGCKISDIVTFFHLEEEMTADAKARRRENASLIVRAVNAHDELVAALEECAEYFEDRADADCDQDGYIPNKEMRLLQTVDEALKLARKS